MTKGTYMSNFNSTVVFNTNLLAKLAADPEAGRKIAQICQSTMFGGDTALKYDGVQAAIAVETHKGDQVRLVAVGGDTGRDIGSAGPVANMTEGQERALFEAATANYDLVVRKEAVRGAKDDGAASSEPQAPAAS